MTTLKRLVQVGVMGLRSPTGKVVENVNLYKIVQVAPGTPTEGLTPGEMAVCEEAVQFMAADFRRYMKENAERSSAHHERYHYTAP